MASALVPAGGGGGGGGGGGAPAAGPMVALRASLGVAVDKGDAAAAAAELQRIVELAHASGPTSGAATALRTNGVKAAVVGAAELVALDGGAGHPAATAAAAAAGALIGAFRD